MIQSYKIFSKKLSERGVFSLLSFVKEVYRETKHPHIPSEVVTGKAV